MPEPEKDDIDVQLKDLIKEGKKIEAIKKYRAVADIGLKEAKEYVDVLKWNLCQGHFEKA